MLKECPADQKVDDKKKKLRHSKYTPWMFGREQQDPQLYEGFGTPIDYLNSPEVKSALHIPASTPTWKECSTEQVVNYTMSQKGSQWIYEALKGKYRMMHYSGNLDAVVPSIGTLGWINSMNRTVVKDWRQFSVDGQVGGWIKDYDGLTFVEINGAGHMVPKDKPASISYIINNWMKGNFIPVSIAENA